ncbi:hypothetical protein QM797_19745 [Rhodococcus sp. IEGM 1381]|uniref:hypothetical protein n=1 Tax=Rhodococcus sp. IEGM 1381 TaxID=3047085 RepID=UPI0024B71505|nr:hypothetical protein [Rhodococcus sp. IEGM 1381]MDI9896958.1 hypothetical protein [Rhodococcus sp. IEGM 1381]
MTILGESALRSLARSFSCMHCTRGIGCSGDSVVGSCRVDAGPHRTRDLVVVTRDRRRGDGRRSRRTAPGRVGATPDGV